MKRKCWIVRDQDGLRINDDKPKFWPVETGGLKPGYFETHCIIALEGHCPPQLRKMWRKALKGKRGENAICECVWETWVPIIEVDCMTCDGNGFLDKDEGCWECDGLGQEFTIMTQEDL